MVKFCLAVHWVYMAMATNADQEKWCPIRVVAASEDTVSIEKQLGESWLRWPNGGKRGSSWAKNWARWNSRQLDPTPANSSQVCGQTISNSVQVENLARVGRKFEPDSQLEPSGWPNNTQLHPSWKLGSSWLELGVPFGQDFKASYGAATDQMPSLSTSGGQAVVRLREDYLRVSPATQDQRRGNLHSQPRLRREWPSLLDRHQRKGDPRLGEPRLRRPRRRLVVGGEEPAVRNAGGRPEPRHGRAELPHERR